MHKDESLDRLLERTSRHGDEARPAGACLDAQTLAAWAEGSLTGRERVAAEAHAADCDRCLAVLASIARTSPPPSPVQRPSWLSVRWLVPLATAAVAITAWVVVQQPPAEREPSRVDAPAADAARPAAPAAPEQPEASSRNRVDTVQKKADAPARPKAKEQDDLRRADAPAEKKPAAAADRLGAVAEQRQAASTPPPAAAATSASKQVGRELKDERAERQMRAFAQLAPIVSPDPNVRWRLSGPTVERSTDSGQTWQTQATGTDVDLLAGTAPSATVCWIVGRSGLVLVSTDGATWRPVDFPDRTADLVGVAATSALAAAVTTASGRTYRTVDGGRTWTLQENPPAPF